MFATDRAVFGFLFAALLSVTAVAQPVADPAYPWSVEVKGVVSKETGHAPRAHLWLPPDGAPVTSLVLGMHNMLEEPIFAHPKFREILAAHHIGICWVSPMIPQNWQTLATNEIAAIEGLCNDLADRTHHPELKTIPLSPIGHSAMATFPYLWAAARPARTRTAVSLKGDWPCEGRPWTINACEQAVRAKVPLLLVSGEYEDGYNRRELSKDLFKRVPDATFTMWIDDGGGHFDWSDELCVKLANWFAGSYDGVPFVRGERGKGKQFTVLGVEVDGKILSQNPKAHLQIVYSVTTPEFEVKPVFDAIVPPGRPETWTGLPAGSPNPWPQDSAAESRLVVQNIDGPIEQIGPRRFRVKNRRYDPAGRRVRSAAFQIVYPGDATFKRSVQQFEVRLPRIDVVRAPSP